MGFDNKNYSCYNQKNKILKGGFKHDKRSSN